jgi:hypothetical protein
LREELIKLETEQQMQEAAERETRKYKAAPKEKIAIDKGNGITYKDIKPAPFPTVKPAVVLFGPTDPRQWHPWKTASEVVESLHGVSQGARSMHTIGVEQVTAAAARLLDRKTGREEAVRPRPTSVRRMCDGAVAYRAAAEPARKPLAHAH